VHVDLGARTGAGESGEGDLLSGVEDVAGGRGDDLLVGDGGDNGLFGGRGDDRLLGRPGADWLDGGRDTGSMACGPGDRVAARARWPSALAAGCELIASPWGPRLSTACPRVVEGRGLRYRLDCPPDVMEGVVHQPPPCSARLRIREASGRRRLLADGASGVGRRPRRAIDAELTELGRRLAARRRGVEATVTVVYRLRYGAGFGRERLRWIVRLEVPRVTAAGRGRRR
jgi:hypothetical protein